MRQFFLNVQKKSKYEVILRFINSGKLTLEEISEITKVPLKEIQRLEEVQEHGNFEELLSNSSQRPVAT